MKNHHAPEIAAQVDEEKEQLRSQIAALQRENQALQTDLRALRQSQSAQEQTAKLEQASAAFQVELNERHRSERESQKRLEILPKPEGAALEQVAELARANAALRQSIDALTDQPSVKAFLSTTLKAIAEVLEVPSVCLWKYEDEWSHLQWVYQDGAVIPAEASNHPNARQPTFISKEPDSLGFGALHTYPYFFCVDDPNWVVGDIYIEMFQRLGVRGLLTAPIVVGDRPVGCITARLTHEMPDPSPARLELVNALANQAALALQMADLAESAKQAAIAREQEKAARERAAELARANAALRQSIDALITQPSIEAVLGTTLQAIADVLEVPSACLWYFEGDLAYLRLLYQDGQVTPGEHSNHVNAKYPSGAVKTHTTQPCLLHADDPTVEFAGEHRTMFQQLGVRAVFCVPIVIGDCVVGSVTARLTHEMPDPAPTRIELMNALANQAALALQMAELAETSKQAAIVREQKKAAQERVAELAKANAVLQESLRRLADEPELDKFLGHVLTVCAKQFGAIGAAIWQLEEKTAYLIASYSRKDGNVYTPDERLYPAVVQAIVPQKYDQKSRLQLSKGEILVHHKEDFQAIPEYQVFLEWLQQQGVKTALSTPMFFGEALRGCLSLRFDHRRTFTTEEAELAHALANQAMLALELTRLAEAARQTAIAREQEKAAQERAAELAKANAALRRSIDALTTQSSIESFLGVTLQAIADVLEVPSACLWHFEGELAYLQLVYQNGQVIPGKQSNHVNAKHPSHEVKPAWDAVKMFTTRPYFHAIGAPTVRYTNEQIAMFQQLGVRGVISAPIVIGDCAVGAITARLTYEMPDPSSARLELVNALANQAALALQMAELAETSKQAIVLEERNRMAGEIHDTLAQAFTGISIQVKVAQKLMDTNPVGTQQTLDRIRALALTGLTEARRSVWELHSSADEYADLARNLQDCLHRLTDGSPIQVELEMIGTPYPVSAIVGQNLLRIAQEAIHNAVKHAQATQLRVKLSYEPAAIALSIQDNGRGFELDNDTGGFGLISMSERASRLHGQFDLHSQPGEGTEIAVRIPIH
jgi:signal transduction histidine kinase